MVRRQLRWLVVGSAIGLLAAACGLGGLASDSLCTESAVTTVVDVCRVESAYAPEPYRCLQAVGNDAGPAATAAQRSGWGASACKAGHSGSLMDCLATRASECRPDGGYSPAASDTLVQACLEKVKQAETCDAACQSRKEACRTPCQAARTACDKACSATTALGCWDCAVSCGLQQADCENRC